MPMAMHPHHLVPLLLPLLMLLLQTTTVVSSPATHVYPAECVPPGGAITTAPPGNDTYPNPLLPIDFCCPQVKDCRDINGFCALNWLIDTVLPGCDFKMDRICKDYGCSCCIKCSADKCSKCTASGGNCRVKCRADETRDYFKKCGFKSCQCCKKCTENDECKEAKGKCFANHYDCPGGMAASTGCCGGCYCCKPELQKLFPCEKKTGSYCSMKDDCATGYYPCFGECEATEFVNGLQQTAVGYCCSPKIPAGGNPGRIGAFDFYVNKAAGDSFSDNQLYDKEILSAELDDLSPRPQGDNAQENVIEDQIYDAVEPVGTKGQQNTIGNSELEADIEIQNVENVPSPNLVSVIQEDSDTDDALPIDIPIDLSYQENNNMDAGVAIDSPIDISDQLFYSDLEVNQNNDQVEVNNNKDPKPKHHRRNHHKYIENENNNIDADVAIDSPIDISDQIFYSDLEVDQNNDQVEVNNNKDPKPQHHRRNHHKHIENEN